MTDKIVTYMEARNKILQLWDEQHIRTEEILRFPLEEEFKRLENECKDDTNNYLGPWVAMLDESLLFLFLLYKYCWNQKNENRVGAPTFFMLLARACSHVMAIRKLITGGLEDSARSVSRSFMETIDLLLVSLIDEEFSDLYFSEDIDENLFWKTNVAYGRIYHRIDKVIELAGIDESEREDYILHRKEAKKFLSGSVHSDRTSAFRSMLIPSLKHYGKLSTSVLGHVSTHSPGHLSLIITEVYYFGSIFLKLLIKDKLNKLVKGSIESIECKSFTTSFFVLQELVTEHYEEYLTMELGFPEE